MIGPNVRSKVLRAGSFYFTPKSGRVGFAARDWDIEINDPDGTMTKDDIVNCFQATILMSIAQTFGVDMTLRGFGALESAPAPEEDPASSLDAQRLAGDIIARAKK